MGAAGTAGAAHTLTLAPRAPELQAPYANNSFPYDRGPPLRSTLTALAFFGHGGVTAIFWAPPVPNGSAVGTSSRHAGCALIERRWGLLHHTAPPPSSSAASYTILYGSNTMADQASLPPLPSETPPSKPPLPGDAEIAEADRADPDSPRDPAPPPSRAHYQDIDPASIPMDLPTDLAAPLGYPGHYQVTGQGGQTEEHDPAVLRFINAYAPGVQITPAVIQAFGTDFSKRFFKCFGFKIENPEDVFKICRTTVRPPESGGKRRAQELHSTGTILVKLPREQAQQVYITQREAITPRYITRHDEQSPCGLEIGGNPPIPPEARPLHRIYLTHRDFATYGGGSLQACFRASLCHLYRLAEEFHEDLAPEEGPELLAQLTADLESGLRVSATDEVMEPDGTEDGEEDEHVNLQFSAKSLLRMLDFHSLHKKGAYSTTIVVEYIDTQITSFMRDIFGAGDCRLAFPLITPRGMRVLNLQVTAQPPGHQVDDASDAALHSPDQLQDYLCHSLVLRHVNLSELEKKGLRMPSLEDLATALEATLDDERSLSRLLAISGWLKPLLPPDHPALISPDNRAYPVPINKSSTVGTKGLLVLGDSSATFEEASGLLVSMSTPVAALQLLLLEHVNVRFTQQGNRLAPAAALTAGNFPGKGGKRQAIAERARRAQGSVYVSLLVGSYFGSRMKSFNPKVTSKTDRQAFVKSNQDPHSLPPADRAPGCRSSSATWGPPPFCWPSSSPCPSPSTCPSSAGSCREGRWTPSQPSSSGVPRLDEHCKRRARPRPIGPCPHGCQREGQARSPGC